MNASQVTASISCKYEYSKGKRSKHPKVKIYIKGLKAQGFFRRKESRRLMVVDGLELGLCLCKAASEAGCIPNPIRTFTFSDKGDNGCIQFDAQDLGFPEEEFDNVPFEITSITGDELNFEQITLTDIHGRLAEQEAQAKELEDAYRQRLEEGNSVGQLPSINTDALDELEREANTETLSAQLERLRVIMAKEGVRKLTVKV